MHSFKTSSQSCDADIKQLLEVITKFPILRWLANAALVVKMLLVLSLVTVIAQPENAHGGECYIIHWICVRSLVWLSENIKLKPLMPYVEFWKLVVTPPSIIWLSPNKLRNTVKERSEHKIKGYFLTQHPRKPLYILLVIPCLWIFIFCFYIFIYLPNLGANSRLVISQRW